MKDVNLNKINMVIVTDYSDYDENKCNDGGHYSYSTIYTKVKEGWEVSYGTSADFTFCPVCGSFEDHYEGDESRHESGYSCGEYETTTDEEVLKAISFAETKEDWSYKIIEEEIK